jgi:hypothetical protein
MMEMDIVTGKLYVDQIELLIDKYEKVDVKTMGFPDDWKKLLEQK